MNPALSTWRSLSRAARFHRIGFNCTVLRDGDVAAVWWFRS